MSETVRITGLGAQGDGIAALAPPSGETEGGSLFVPGTLPGETASILRTVAPVAGSQGRAASPPRATLLAVLDLSPARQDPPCAFFDRCGGCVVQHGSDAFVADWKRDLVRIALEARLGPAAAAISLRATATVPAESRRRLTVTARRLRQGVVIGFHGRAAATILPVTTCAVARPALVAALPRIEELAGALASRKGELRLTLSESTAGIDCAVTGAKPLSGAETALLAGVAARGGLARLALDGEPVVTIRPPVHEIGGVSVLPPPGAFLQPTEAGAETLTDLVLEALCLGPHHERAVQHPAAPRPLVAGALSGPGARRMRRRRPLIADLFAGIGTFALPLGAHADLEAYELEGPAIAALEAAWRGGSGEGGPLKGRLEAARRNLFHRPLEGASLDRLDGVVIDPPRAGARAQAEALAKSGVPRIASVSCNPATFARDARILIDGGYVLDWVAPVDQFRWSAHVELIGAFRRPA